MRTPIKAESKSPSQQTRASDLFRKEHEEIKTHLRHIEQWCEELQASSPERQKKTMAKIVTFLQEHILNHAEWEERQLYPAVDKRVDLDAEQFTSTMRYEHQIIVRWTSELDKMAQEKKVSSARFVRKTDQLLGLILAHFEEEEQVLLPILDNSMSAAEFESEILNELKH